MEKVILNLERREKGGKGVARSLRRQGIIPAVLYKGGNSLPVQISRKEISQFINKTAGKQVVVDLQFPDDMRQAILKDYQVDPIRGDLLHVDLQEVAATETIRAVVQVAIRGDAVGIKRDRGILQYGIRGIEVECLPGKLPGHVNVDVSKMEIGQSIHVGDLKIEEGIHILTDPEEVVVTIAAVKEKEEIAPLTTETVEPEIVKKSKKVE
ncbi:50S ribosomal protein L25 [Thermodesulfovibrionales bacterium]|nr:50S ribosomal protein L25 [Thermodesulfovibrionales bacterium]